MVVKYFVVLFKRNTSGISNLTHLIFLKVTLMNKGFFCNFNKIQKLITVSKIYMKIIIDEKSHFSFIFKRLGISGSLFT